MTINATANRRTAIANAGNTVFTFSFTVNEESDLQVFRRLSSETPSDSSQLQTLNVDYTVIITGDSGGSITLIEPAVQNEVIVIQTKRVADRETDFSPDKDYTADNINAEFDNQVFLQKQTSVKTDSLTPRYPSSSLPTSGDLNLPILEEGEVWYGTSGGVSVYRIGADDPSAEALRAELAASDGDSLVGDAIFGDVQQAVSDLNDRGPIYGVDTSIAPNDIIVELVPSPSTPPLFLFILVASNNTDGEVFLEIDGLPPKPVIRMNGDSLDSDDLRAGTIYPFIWDGTSYRTSSGTTSTTSSEWPPRYMSGLECKPGTLDPSHDVTFSAGFCRDQLDTMDIEVDDELTKRIDASWAAGDGAGGLASDNILAAGDTLHAWVIARTNGVSDIGFDKSNPPTGLLADATGYTKYRYIDSFRVIDVAGDKRLRLQKRTGDYVAYMDDLVPYKITQVGVTTPIEITTLPIPAIRCIADLYVRTPTENVVAILAVIATVYTPGASNPGATKDYNTSESYLFADEWEYVSKSSSIDVETSSTGSVMFVANGTNFTTTLNVRGWTLRRDV
jgi:hypothetical protein